MPKRRKDPGRIKLPDVTAPSSFPSRKSAKKTRQRQRNTSRSETLSNAMRSNKIDKFTMIDSGTSHDIMRRSKTRFPDGVVPANVHVGSSAGGSKTIQAAGKFALFPVDVFGKSFVISTEQDGYAYKYGTFEHELVSMGRLISSDSVVNMTMRKSDKSILITMVSDRGIHHVVQLYSRRNMLYMIERIQEGDSDPSAEFVKTNATAVDFDDHHDDDDAIFRVVSEGQHLNGEL